VLGEVIQARAKHPRLGVRKLYIVLEPFLLDHQIKLGRDGLFDLLSRHNLLVRRRKRRVQTTNSRHRYRIWPDLFKGSIPSRPDEYWVGDITYWDIGGRFLYISLITDAFSHKIVGYRVAETLEAESSVEALEYALGQRKDRAAALMHHSDRGIQYCCRDYIACLQAQDVQISMTQSGDPLDNALAERVNGILKEEYLDYYKVGNITEAKKMLRQAVQYYNEERPHLSIGNQTPGQVHQSGMQTQKLWKTYYRKKGLL